MNDDIAEQVAKTLNRKTEPKETIILRLRPTLRKQVDEAARNAGVSRNAFITDALAKQMEE